MQFDPEATLYAARQTLHNRKLYDTEAKRYITLHDIAALIRQGAQLDALAAKPGVLSQDT